MTNNSPPGPGPRDDRTRAAIAAARPTQRRRESWGNAMTDATLASNPLRDLRDDEPIPAWVWRGEKMLAALAVRDIGTVFDVLQMLGLSQRKIGARTGQSQSQISEILGGRRVTAYDVLCRIADGLGVPRGYLGLAHVGPPAPEVPPSAP